MNITKNGIKKIISILLVALLAIGYVGVLAGCGSDRVSAGMDGGVRSQEGLGSLDKLDGNLYYDRDTQIVYYVFAEKGGYSGYGYMSPYYSKNGKLCRYVDGKIVEVDSAGVENN